MEKVNVIRKQVVNENSHNVCRAEQVLLSSINFFKVPVGHWSSGINAKTSNITLAIPLKELDFNGADRFLECLRQDWLISGFKIVNERDDVGYQSDYAFDYSHIFDLEIAM